MSDLISVVLPVFNGSRYISEAITSILTQEAIEFELVISDDKSTDCTLDIVNNFSDPRVRILRSSENLGIFGNLNRAIRATKGSFIQVFSQDDVMLPGFLCSQRAAFLRNSRIGLVYGLPQYIDDVGRSKDSTPDETPELITFETYVWLASHYGALPASISSIMIRRAVIEEVGLFNEQYKVAGDLDFYNRVAERFLIGYDKTVHHRVRAHAQATSALPSSGPKYLAEEVLLEAWFRKHWTASEYEKVRFFRCAWRARFHIGWIRRLAATGRLKEALGFLLRLHDLCPLYLVAWAYVLRLSGGRSIDTPRIARPFA